MEAFMRSDEVIKALELSDLQPLHFLSQVPGAESHHGDQLTAVKTEESEKLNG